MIDASKLYYFCPRCRRFHEYSTGKKVSKNLCLICGELSDEKTRVIRSEDGGALQLCLKCEEMLLESE